jgi:Uma2 family endonuclease
VDVAALERHEVVDGVVVEKAAPTFEHGSAQLELAAFVREIMRRDRGGPHGWWFATGVEIEFESHEVYLPDVAGWRRDRVPTRPAGRPVRIRPDWVCEVLSPSTAKRDLVAKHHTFLRCGVGHYWVLDPERETLTVFRRTDEGYLAVLTAGREDRVRAEPFAEVELTVADLFGGDDGTAP